MTPSRSAAGAGVVTRVVTRVVTTVVMTLAVAPTVHLFPPGAPRLAVIVAYEHHMRPDGKGYPAMRYERDLHYASKIVSVCDVYDALRTTRTHRPAWAPGQALGFVEDGAGTVFDAGVARALSARLACEICFSKRQTGRRRSSSLMSSTRLAKHAAPASPAATKNASKR